MVPAIDR